jgi:hypothetical protein
MNATLLTAIAAALGSLVGAIASIATTWINQRTQSSRAATELRLRECAALYKEFVTEASRLAADAMFHSLEKPEQLVTLYGILSRIRLVSSDTVLANADECCRRIIDLYRQPNLGSDDIQAALESHDLDFLRDFSLACRDELTAMAQTSGPK